MLQIDRRKQKEASYKGIYMKKDPTGLNIKKKKNNEKTNEIMNQNKKNVI